MRHLAKVLAILGFVGVAHSASAATIDVTVDGRAGPWSHAANPDLVYSSDSWAPTVVSGHGLSFATGSQFTISYLSGYTQTVYFYGQTDGNGYNNIQQSDVSVPAQFASNKDIAHLQALIGAFADGTGKVVGTPFVVGNLGTFAAPAGAAELLLGINDNHYADNLGALTIGVSSVSAVPLPAAAPMFGAALLAFGAVGYGMKRWKAAVSA